MKISDVIKSKNIQIEEKKDESSKSVSKRRYFWDEEESLIPEKTLKNSLNETLNVPEKFPTSSLKIKAREITGQQRQIVMFIYQQVIKNPNRKTDEISTNDLIEVLKKDKSEKSQESIRHNILALIKKGCLKKEGYKSGPGGYSQYSIPEDLIIQISQIPEKSPINSLNNSLNNSLKNVHSKEERELKYKNVLITNYPNVEKIGLKIEHLQKCERTEENLTELLTHYEHSLVMNEIRVPQKLPVLISIINDPTKTWVSECYLKCFNDELDANQKRMKQIEQIKKEQTEMKLRDKYQEFLTQNENFKKEVLEKQIFKNLTPEVLETIFFEEFKTKNPNF
jgi:hypothetical protein